MRASLLAVNLVQQRDAAQYGLPLLLQLHALILNCTANLVL